MGYNIVNVDRLSHRMLFLLKEIVDPINYGVETFKLVCGCLLRRSILDDSPRNSMLISKFNTHDLISWLRYLSDLSSNSLCIKSINVTTWHNSHGSHCLQSKQRNRSKCLQPLNRSHCLLNLLPHQTHKYCVGN